MLIGRKNGVFLRGIAINTKQTRSKRYPSETGPVGWVGAREYTDFSAKGKTPLTSGPIGWGCKIKRCSRCILQPQLTGKHKVYVLLAHLEDDDDGI